MVPTFVGATLLTFLVARLAPGDPILLDGERGVVVSEQRAPHDFSAPLPVQYGRWLKRVITLDFGRSLTDQRPVADKLAECLPRTALLAGLAWLVAYGVALPLGVWLAIRRHRWTARLMSHALVLTWSIPPFWVAVVALLWLATPHGVVLFPLQGLGEGGLDRAWHLVLPVLCLALPGLSVATRQVQAAVTSALGSDYVLAARARGLPERRVIWNHAVRSTLLPFITLAGASLPHLVSGSVLIERVFGIPGMGLLAFDAIGARDYPTVMATATVMAVATMVSVLLVDLAYPLADPRVLQGDAT